MNQPSAGDDDEMKSIDLSQPAESSKDIKHNDFSQMAADSENHIGEFEIVKSNANPNEESMAENESSSLLSEKKE